MLAAENGALPRGKVGGLGDVTRELPRALARRGHSVVVVSPAYGRREWLDGARRLGTLPVTFAGASEHAGWYLAATEDNVEHHLIDHARLAPRGDGEIYHDDASDRPFFTDATKFAFFSAAAAALVRNLSAAPDVVHLHDWHLGLYLALRAFDPAYASLLRTRTVFTIHNLALQGVRPLAETSSSLATWFPGLRYRLRDIRDPDYLTCVNPMAIAVRLADMLNTVSPSYAREIQQPDDAEHGFHGGERLDPLLEAAASEGRLVGILNGCDYPRPRPKRPGYRDLTNLIRSELTRFIAGERMLASAHYLAERRLESFGARRPTTLLTSIGRVVDQKLGLFLEPAGNGRSAIEQILSDLPGTARMIMLGSGDSGLEQYFAGVCGRFPNFMFLRGYSDELAQALYASGDVFLMPSSFEPCGIGQMLAMRAGQPCIAHAVGGLKDTVDPDNGFPFGGDSLAGQARNLVRTVAEAVRLQETGAEKWKAIQRAARDSRFDWADSADRYLREVYGSSRA